MKKPEIYNIKPVINADYVISSVKEIICIIIVVIISYYVIKLYRKLIKFLDKNS
jgi:hypothetical protein